MKQTINYQTKLTILRCLHVYGLMIMMMMITVIIILIITIATNPTIIHAYASAQNNNNNIVYSPWSFSTTTIFAQRFRWTYSKFFHISLRTQFLCTLFALEIIVLCCCASVHRSYAQVATQFNSQQSNGQWFIIAKKSSSISTAHKHTHTHYDNNLPLWPPGQYTPFGRGH